MARRAKVAAAAVASATNLGISDTNERVGTRRRVLLFPTTLADSVGMQLRFAFALATGIVVLANAAAPAAAPAPPAKLTSSDTAYIGKPFALDFFNWTIATIAWMPDNAPQMKQYQIESQPDRGSLVLRVAIKNSSDSSANVPTPIIQAIFKDGSSSGTGENASAFTASGKRADSNAYPPGAGTTVVYVVPNIPKPDSANPITKLVFQQSFTGLKPELIRLLAPPVTVDATAPAPSPTPDS